MQWCFGKRKHARVATSQTEKAYSTDSDKLTATPPCRELQYGCMHIEPRPAEQETKTEPNLRAAAIQRPLPRSTPSLCSRDNSSAHIEDSQQKSPDNLLCILPHPTLAAYTNNDNRPTLVETDLLDPPNGNVDTRTSAYTHSSIEDASMSVLVQGRIEYCGGRKRHMRVYNTVADGEQ